MLSRALALALAVCGGTTAKLWAQQPPKAEAGETWSWDSIAQVAPDDSTRLTWLRENLSREEAAVLIGMVQQLSDPSAAQLLPSRFYADPSFHMRRTWYGGLDSLVELLSKRPPVGRAGLIRIAYAVERIRRTVGREVRKPYSSSPPSLDIDSGLQTDRLRVHLDFQPARRLLRILDGDDIEGPEIDRLKDDSVFRALFSHRSQSFYPMAVTPEVFTENLRLAASNRPIDLLYRYAFPVGLMHFTDVRDRREYYRGLVDTLSIRSADIAALISGQLGPYVPAAAHIERTVHFLFADGADGWAADGLAAIDLEYFGNDYRRLIRLLAHEAYHAVQASVYEPTLTRKSAVSADSVFAEVLDAVYREGLASYVAPPREVSSAEYDSLVARGMELLAGIHTALLAAEEPDIETSSRFRDEGMRSSGPLYWVGAEMAKRIERRLGRDRLVETLREGGIRFFATYLDAAGTERGKIPLIDGDFAASVRRLASGIAIGSILNAPRYRTRDPTEHHASGPQLLKPATLAMHI